MGEFRFPDVPGTAKQAEERATESQAAEPRAPAEPEREAPAPEHPEPGADAEAPAHRKPATDAEASKQAPLPSGAPKRRLWPRILIYALLLLAAALVIAVVVTGVRLYPWLRGPDESREVIEARWAKVEALARVEPVGGDDTALLDAAEGIRGFQPPNAGADPLPLLERDQLEEEHAKALDTFVAWHRGGGKYIAAECGDMGSRRERSSLYLYRLGQLSLLTAEKSDVMQVEAVLSLALGQRRRGRLIDFVIGVSLAEQSAEWSQARGVSFAKELERYRPTVDQLRRTLARDAACVIHMLDSSKAPLAIEPKRLTASEHPPFGIVRPERERLVYMDLHGRLLERAVAAGDDHEQLIAAYRDANTDKAKSMLLDSTWFYQGVIEKALSRIARYDELVPKR